MPWSCSGRQANVLKSVMQSYCFAHTPNCFCLFVCFLRCHCCRRRRRRRRRRS